MNDDPPLDAGDFALRRQRTLQDLISRLDDVVATIEEVRDGLTAIVSRASDSPTAVVLTVDQAAHVLGSTSHAIYAAVRRGDLPSFRLGGSIRIPLGAVAAMVGVRPDEVSAALSSDGRPTRRTRRVRLVRE